MFLDCVSEKILSCIYVRVKMLCTHLQARRSMEFVDSLLTNMLDLAKTQAGKLELEVKRSVLAQ